MISIVSSQKDSMPILMQHSVICYLIKSIVTSSWSILNEWWHCGVLILKSLLFRLYFLYSSILLYLSILLYFRAEAIYLRLSKSPYVSNAARRVLNLPLITEQDLSQRNILQQNGISPKRKRNQSSGNSESSVEVITELDEESKFENGLMAAGHF